MMALTVAGTAFQAEAETWSKLEIRPSGTTSSPATNPNSGSNWTFPTSTGAGFATAGDSVTFTSTAGQKNCSIEWKTRTYVAGESTGTRGIMIRADSSPTSAFAFAGQTGGQLSCSFIVRPKAGAAVQAINIPGPLTRGAILRLDLVGNIVLLKARQTASNEWTELFGADLFESSQGQFGIDLKSSEGSPINDCLIGLASVAATASLATTPVAELSIGASGYSRWHRVIEPTVPLNPVRPTTYPVTGTFGEIVPSLSGPRWTLETNSTGGYTGNDISVVSLTNEALKINLQEIPFPLPSTHEGAAYIRLHTASSAMLTALNLSTTSPMGIWVKLKDLSRSSSSPYLGISLDSGLQTGTFKMDGILIVSRVAEPDTLQSGIPDRVIGEGHKIPNVGDWDGDGLANYLEYQLGRDPEVCDGWRTPVVELAAGESAARFAPVDHWLTSGLSARMVYADTLTPVPFGSLTFKRTVDPELETLPLMLAAFQGPVAEPQALTILADQNGNASVQVWPYGPLTETNYLGGAYAIPSSQDSGTVTASWELKGYHNSAPSRIVVDATNKAVALASQVSLEGMDVSAIAAAGGFMAVADSSLGNEKVHILKKDSATGDWSFVHSVPSKPSKPSCLAMKDFENGTLLVIGEANPNRIRFFNLGISANDGPVSFTSAGETSLDATPKSLAINGSLSVIGFPDYVNSAGEAKGKVEIYTGSGLGMTLVPHPTGHSDRFGAAVAIAPDAQTIAVGAPSNLQWFQNADNVGMPWPVTPRVYLYEKLHSSFSPAGSLIPSVIINTATSSFGTSLAFEGNDKLIVGSPSAMYPEVEVPLWNFSRAGVVRTYKKNSTTGSFDYVQTISSNPGFGAMMATANGRHYLFAPGYTPSGLPYVPGFLKILTWPGTYAALSSELLLDENVKGMAGSDNTLMVNVNGAASEYSLVPAVSHTASTGSVAATVYPVDPNVTNGVYPHEDFTETMTTSLVATNPTGIFSLHNSGNPLVKELRVADSPTLFELAGQVAWAQVSSRDFAGDEVSTITGVKVTAPAPVAPTGLAAEVTGRYSSRVFWSKPSPVPLGYIIEKADLADHVAAASPEAKDALFQEFVRVPGMTVEVPDSIDLQANQGWVYRVRSRSEEAVSAPSSVFELDFDAESGGAGDGYPDWWESLFPGYTFGSGTNADGDAWTDLQEYQNGTDPTVADSDGDGVNDDADVVAGVQYPRDRNRNPYGLVVNTELQSY